MNIDSLKDNNIFEKIKNVNIDEFIFNYRLPIIIFLLGSLLIGLGVFYLKNDTILGSDKIEVISEPTQSQEENSQLVVEIVGAVEKPGVYKLISGSRIEDLLVSAGGFSKDADREWVEKTINRAAKLIDGQKIIIKSTSEQSISESANNTGNYQTISSVQGSAFENLININTATLKELDTLVGIGPVYGQSIIDHRPYSSIEELVTKGALKQSVYEKIKEMVTVY